MAQEREINDYQFRQQYYTDRLEELGLTHEQIEEVHARLTTMRNEAVVVGDATIELLRKRAQHDLEMKKLLGETGYEKYRQLEAEKSPFQQLQNGILHFAKERNVEIDPLIRPTLVSLMASHGLTTYETWEGPYDPMPRPGVGVQSGIEFLRGKLSKAQNLENFIAESTEILPKEIVSVVAEFFRAEFTEAEKSINFLGLPPEERLAIERAELQDIRRRAFGRD